MLCLNWVWVLQPRVVKRRSEKSLVCSHPRSSESHMYKIIHSLSAALWGNVLLPPLVAAASPASLIPSSRKHPACLSHKLPNPGKTDEGPISSWRIDLTEEYQAILLRHISYDLDSPLTAHWLWGQL